MPKIRIRLSVFFALNVAFISCKAGTVKTNERESVADDSPGADSGSSGAGDPEGNEDIAEGGGSSGGSSGGSASGSGSEGGEQDAGGTASVGSGTGGSGTGTNGGGTTGGSTTGSSTGAEVEPGPPDYIDDDQSVSGFHLQSGSKDIQINSNRLRIDTWTPGSQISHNGTSFDDEYLNTSGLWAYFRFNGTQGNPLSTAASGVVDLSSNARHGTLMDSGGGSASVFTEGKFQQGLSFDGVDNRISLPSFSESPMSVNVWIKKAAWAGGGDQYIIANMGGVEGFRVYINNAGSIVLQAFENCCNWTLTADITSLATDTWHMLTFTYDDDDFDFKLFVNGSLWGLHTYFSGPIIYDRGGGVPVTCIGSANDSSSCLATDVFAGEMDEMTFWSRALSNQEIFDLYARGMGQVHFGSDAIYVSRIFDSGATDTTWNQLEYRLPAPYGLAIDITRDESDFDHGFSQAMEDALVAYFPFDGSGSLANNATTTDASLSPLTATVFNTDGLGSDYGSGLFGESLVIADGNDDIRIADAAKIELTSEFAIAMWLKIPDFTEYSRLWDKSAGNTGYAFGIDDYASFYATAGDGSALHNVVAESYPLQLNEWHHVAVTWKSGEQRIYVDGQAVPLASGGALAVAPTASGATTYVADDWNGSLDELLVFSRALTSVEIAALHARGAGQVKWQMTPCALADCSDSAYVGPDDTDGTYFDLSHWSSGSVPNFSFTTPPTARYFRYKTILRTTQRDFTPEIQRVEIRPQP